ncbi:glutamyl-tRNA amidotransferase [Coprinopsis marcescibilis]|uniref:Glutamyl-tRNA(Gln) amidotransferase subunit B, mitochondrial n=1 Tax=Coprinopsis marcescibilis TaxID=230819 RepID=A0A5C3L8A5_COPMA|nr:glutamyl-tRNA amidotransferase [Coprinopsis marcescibilis]
MFLRLGQCSHLRCSLRYRAFHSYRGVQEDSRWPGYQVIIGIETHAQIKSRHKLFSNALTSEPSDSTNDHVVVFDAAFPGTLPKLNPNCVDLAIRTALALKSNIQKSSSFDRKHYFYSDLPSGYQITQQYAPIATNGYLQIPSPNLSSEPIQVRIKQIQLEQDTAKSTFNPRTLTSQIDLNRAGTGLMEIVTLPDLRSPEEAGAYVRTLQALLRAVGSSDGNMEQGSLRCDVNVSVNRIGQPPGTRCEIKNLNSVRFMMAAITHETQRQLKLLAESPFTVPQETRGFNEDTFETFKLRSKEDAPDYRYMPDPNLGVLSISEARIAEVKAKLPELPWQMRDRLKSIYGLSDKDTEVLMKIETVKDVPFDGRIVGTGGSAVDYFDALCESQKRDPKIVFNWLGNELLGQLTSKKASFTENPINSDQLGQLIDMVQDGTLTGTSGKYLLRHLLSNPSGKTARDLAEELQLVAFTSGTANPTASPSSPASSELDSLVQDAITALPKEVAAYKSGHQGVLNKIVGWVIKQSRGRADAKTVRIELERVLKQ